MRTRILRQLLDFITRENASLAPLARLIRRMQSELNTCYETIWELNQKISHAAVFSEQFLQNDECVKLYTGLPSVLKAVFDFVLPPTEYFNNNPTKLTAFQEFMIVLAKLRLDSPLQDFANKCISGYCVPHFVKMAYHTRY